MTWIRKLIFQHLRKRSRKQQKNKKRSAFQSLPKNRNKRKKPLLEALLNIPGIPSRRLFVSQKPSSNKMLVRNAPTKKALRLSASDLTVRIASRLVPPSSMGF